MPIVSDNKATIACPNCGKMLKDISFVSLAEVRL